MVCAALDPFAQEDVRGQTGMLVRRSGMVWKG
jgi:hypothetical protein